MTVRLHRGDLPDLSRFSREVAIDTETMGLEPHRDRLCVVQLSAGDGNAHVVRLNRPAYDCPNLKRVLADRNVLKLFHFGRFDIGMFQLHLGVETRPVYCTKIASKLIRTYTDRHGLKYLLMEYAAADVSKAQQTSDWGSAELTDAQKGCNAAMRSTRITVKKNYAMVSNLFPICSNTDNYKIAKEKPYAIEQLRVCTLLTNCYVCMNGDVAGSDNTFGLSPPMLSEYLRL